MIELESVTKKYKESIDDNVIIENMNINFQSGMIHCIIGASGAGKSTLLNMLGCLDTQFSGNIKFLGYDIKKIKMLERFRNRHIGFMFQSHNLLPQLNVKENILLPAQLYNKDINDHIDTMNRLLDYIGLNEKKDTFPYQLSGGERQRVAFVRALINRPDVIIADEPTGNLDSKNSKNIVDLIIRYNKEFNQTFIIATHDELVSKSANILYEINNKKCIKL